MAGVSELRGNFPHVPQRLGIDKSDISEKQCKYVDFLVFKNSDNTIKSTGIYVNFIYFKHTK